MCCAFAALALFGPRALILVWALVEPARWSAAFDTFFWPLLGFVLLPWTTLVFVIVAPLGVDGLEWVWLALGVVADLASYGGGGFTNRERFASSM